MTPRTAGWWAALAHRLSGLALAAFLPAHFLMLGLALEGEAALDAGLAYAEIPLVRVAEWGLVTLLALHLSLGLRLLALEFLGWAGFRHGWIWGGAAASLAVGALFLAVA